MLAIDAYEARERANYWRAGLVAAQVANGNRKRGTKAMRPEDFIPKRYRAKPQTARQMANALKSLTVAMGGTVRVRS